MIWVAVVLLFLIASAALAIDVSGAYGAAQTDQNTADLSCLAGVKELPNETAAINTAAAYIDANWPEMTGATLTITGSAADYVGIGGNSVFIDADHGGGGDTMYVRTVEIKQNSFGNVVGQESTKVTQEAACSSQTVQIGTGMLPIGALSGLWNGDLFDCAAKVTGNCGALAPDGNGANAYRDAVANGTVGNFIKHHGDKTTPDPGNGYIAIDCFANPCSISKTEPGNMVGPWNQGLTTRFSNISGATCVDEGWFNCDTINDVFGAGLVDLSTISEPSWWEDSIYGDFDLAKVATDAKHHYYNGSTLKCDSPRLATIPIVNKDVDWDIPDGSSNWPNGSKDMKIIGFYTIYIDEPILAADIGGAMTADVIWFGPLAKCLNGDAFQPFGSSLAVDAGVKLVAP